MRAYVVRFAPESGRRARWSACPFRARSRPLLVPELADCDMADGRAACRRPRRSTTRTMIDPIMFSRSIAWNLILRKSALGFRPGVLERADQQQGKQAGPTLSSTQLVEDHRLDVERALVGEAGAEAGLINQPAQQAEIGVPRDHDVEAAVGLQPLAGLLEQGRHVPILRAGVPAAIGEIARLASMLGWAR